MDPHAQAEIRDYAAAMYDLLAPICPMTMEAWRDYELEGLHLSRLEIDALRDAAKGGPGTLASDNRREQAEWQAKASLLGVSTPAANPR